MLTMVVRQEVLIRRRPDRKEVKAAKLAGRRRRKERDAKELEAEQLAAAKAEEQRQRIFVSRESERTEPSFRRNVSKKHCE